MELFKQTSLWTNTLGQDSDVYKDQIEELRSSFLKFRLNTSKLVSRISSTLPTLTDHGIDHLDSLWDTASLIIGEDYPLNPLEGFILGGAFLIHDSALCYEAYANGKKGLRKTNQWKDAQAEISELRQFKQLGKSEIEFEADFIALRELHASQAEKMPKKSWKDPSTGDEIFLIENQKLRKHFGTIIGQIAASHHWNIEELSLKLLDQQNSIEGFPRDWRVDPIKLACILRCADAAHIDNTRAPDYLHALIKKSGISFQHWQAQNRIAKLDNDQSDTSNERLLFTSTMDFEEKDADSWYLAYDAISLFNKELNACNNLLKERDNNLIFQARSVKGVESPESLSKYVKVRGWKPCSAQIHVSNIEKVINSLGGEVLYGRNSDFLEIGIRELIQNSRDSLHARKYSDKNFNGFIKLKLTKKDKDFFIVIEDNGIGMSERVLTGPLLDFGNSFWTSNLIKSEFPGLRSSSFKPIGQFGIGFYSVFMIADEVYVSSKNWDKGLNNVHQICFKNGLSLRPILKNEKPDDFDSSISTQIILKIKPNLIPENLEFEIKANIIGVSNFQVPFDKYLSAICAGLDVPVYYAQNDSKEIRIHQNIKSDDFDIKEWLTDISFSEFIQSDYSASVIEEYCNRIKPIIKDDPSKGLAAISTKISKTQGFWSISTVGGLATSVHNRNDDNFIGFIDFLPKSAKREKEEYLAQQEEIINWGIEQLNDLKKLNLSSSQRYAAASALCHFKVDPTDIAHIPAINNNGFRFYSFSDLAEISLKKEIVFLEASWGGHMEQHHKINVYNPNHLVIVPLKNSSFLNLKFNEENFPVNNHSILDCLYRKIQNKGYTPTLAKHKEIEKNNFGEKINSINISSKIKE